MAIETLSAPSYRRDLSRRLVLRWSTVADTDRLIEMYVEAFRHEKNTPPSLLIWVRDMIGGHHPLVGPGDFALVEDSDRGAIVSATCLLNQVWEYEGIALPVSRPELVATDWDYRERGLVRAIFELIHARSAARGPVSTRVDEAYWRWVLAGQNPEGAEGWRTQLIVDGEGRSVGYVLRARRRSAVIAPSVHSSAPTTPRTPPYRRLIRRRHAGSWPRRATRMGSSSTCTCRTRATGPTLRWS